MPLHLLLTAERCKVTSKSPAINFLYRIFKYYAPISNFLVNNPFDDADKKNTLISQTIKTICLIACWSTLTWIRQVLGRYTEEFGTRFYTNISRNYLKLRAGCLLKFSIGLRSGEFGGQDINVDPLSCS